MFSDSASVQSSNSNDTTFKKIFVGGLPYHTTDASLKSFFEQYGDIEEAVVITDRQTGKSRGYGFVTMVRKNDALQAIRDANPCIDGRKANVNLAVLGAKPRALAGVNNASSLLSMTNCDQSFLNPLLQPSMPVSALLGHGAINPAAIANLLSIGANNIPLLSTSNTPQTRIVPNTGQVPLPDYHGNPFINLSIGLNQYLISQMLYNSHNAQLLNPYLLASLEGVPYGQGLAAFPPMVMPMTTSGNQISANGLQIPSGQIYSGISDQSGIASNFSSQAIAVDADSPQRLGQTFQHILGSDLLNAQNSSMQPLNIKSLNAGIFTNPSNDWQQSLTNISVFQVPPTNGSTTVSTNGGMINSTVNGVNSNLNGGSNPLSSSPIGTITNPLYDMQVGRTEHDIVLNSSNGSSIFM